MTTQDQIESFYQFATMQLSRNPQLLSVDDLYEQWRSMNLTTEEEMEDIAAIKAAIDDMNRGDRGRDAGEIETEMRAKFELPAR